MNNKAIQILRGSRDYDPSEINNELLDGQPFYSKKNELIYVGDKSKQLETIDENGNTVVSYVTRPAGASWIKPGEGKGSFISACLENIDGSPYIEDYLPEATGHESIAFGQGNKALGNRSVIFGGMNNSGGWNNATFGSWNTNNGYDSLLAGLENTNINTHNTIISGLKNNYRDGSNSIISGYKNIVIQSYNIVNGLDNYVTADYNIVNGYNNKSSADYSYLLGSNLQSTKNDNKTVIGYYNLDSDNTLFEIGNGSNSVRNNAFDVTKDGIVRAYCAPVIEKDSCDIVRGNELYEELETRKTEDLKLNKRIDDLDLNAVSGDGFIKIISQESGMVTAEASNTANTLKVCTSPNIAEGSLDVVRGDDLAKLVYSSSTTNGFINSITLYNGKVNVSTSNESKALHVTSFADWDYADDVVTVKDIKPTLYDSNTFNGHDYGGDIYFSNGDDHTKFIYKSALSFNPGTNTLTVPLLDGRASKVVLNEIPSTRWDAERPIWFSHVTGVGPSTFTVLRDLMANHEAFTYNAITNKITCSGLINEASFSSEAGSFNITLAETKNYIIKMHLYQNKSLNKTFNNKGIKKYCEITYGTGDQVLLCTATASYSGQAAFTDKVDNCDINTYLVTYSPYSAGDTNQNTVRVYGRDNTLAASILVIVKHLKN